MGRLAALDADGNGWTDVLMCAQSPTDTFQGVHLFRNDAGRGFRDVTADVGSRRCARRATSPSPTSAATGNRIS